jgi:hypothetical protein
VRKDVQQYCKECDSCQRVTHTNQRAAGLYQPLPLPKKQWSTVTMDLITQLPPTADGNTAIIVFCDKFTKMIHVVPTKTKCDGPEVAHIFLKHVFQYHGMPEQFIHDRDPRFNSSFWKTLFGLCGIKQTNSTAYHPQTDGQTEVVNKSIEDYLRHFGDENQSDWDTLLPYASFAFNNSVHESTGYSPFHLNYGHHPNLPTTWEVYKNVHEESKVQVRGKCPGAEKYFSRVQEAIQVARRTLESSQQRQKAYADESRREVTFNLGDKVLLSTKNIVLKKGSSRKLLPRFIGPFSVIEQINTVAFKIDLPAGLRMHNVFHISLFRPYVEGKSPRSPPIPEVIKGEFEFIVQRIMKFRIVEEDNRKAKKIREFLVRWKGYSAEHDTWEPEDNLHNCLSILEKYKKEHQLQGV